MNKLQGLPQADAAAILKQGFGLMMSRSGICRAIQRTARKAEATDHRRRGEQTLSSDKATPTASPLVNALRDAARHSALAYLDETTGQITFCEILPGRGFAQAGSILGAEYAGWLIHDGWRVYYKLLKAAQQSCVAHWMRRCRDMAEVATPAAARFPLGVGELLQQGLSLRDAIWSGAEDLTARIVDGQRLAGGQTGPRAGSTSTS
jgi:hypothetical protein